MRSALLGVALFGALAFTGCSGWFWGGAAAGAAGAGAVYEHSNKEALEDLEEDYREGKIDKDEYLRRKKEIEDRSVVY